MQSLSDDKLSYLIGIMEHMQQEAAETPSSAQLAYQRLQQYRKLNQAG